MNNILIVVIDNSIVKRQLFKTFFKLADKDRQYVNDSIGRLRALSSKLRQVGTPQGDE